MNELLTIALQKNTEALAKELSRFDYEGFNRVPLHGGWSAGQIAEHLLLVELRIAKILSGRTEFTDRDPQEKVGEMQERLANRSTRIEAPAALVPSDIAKEPKAVTDRLIAFRKELMDFVRDNDMVSLLPDVPHRTYGVMTGFEWVQFLVLHAERHMKQLGGVRA